MATISSTSTQRSKVVLVEDHPLFRERLARLINKDMNMVVCGEADNVEDALLLIESTNPNIAIVDLSLRGVGGMELIKRVRSNGMRTPILVLSMHDEFLYAERVLRAGANGYITKSHASTEVRTAIQKVLGGEIYLNPNISNQLLQRSYVGLTRSPSTGVDLLADRELEVLRLLGSGLNGREIAKQLQLTESTVNCYRFRIRTKLRIKSQAELYQFAANWTQELAG